MFLGAGTVGTTEILLRSRLHGLTTSPLLGQQLSGNGDLLAFAYNTNHEINSIGRESTGSSSFERCGPTITGCIDLRNEVDSPNVKDGFVIQVGAVPEVLAPIILYLLKSQQRTRNPFSPKGLARMIAQMKSWLLGPYCKNGSVQRTLVYLVISHDENEGTLELHNDSISVRWSGPGAERRCREIGSLLAKGSDSIGGTLIKSPAMTVHPLGGARMSNDGTGLGGVVDHMGQVFSGVEHELHRGLHCVDASVIPTSLGKRIELEVTED